MKWRRIFLFGVAGSLTLCALFAIYVVLTGSYTNLSGKIMLTTLSVGFYSLTALCCTPHLEDASYKRAFGYVGIAVSAIGLFYSCLTNWVGFSGWSGFLSLLQFRSLFLVLSIAAAHISLLLIIKPRANYVLIAQMATIFCVAAVTLFISLVLLMGAGALLAWQGILVFSILDALGSIVTPILHSATKNDLAEIKKV